MLESGKEDGGLQAHVLDNDAHTIGRLDDTLAANVLQPRIARSLAYPICNCWICSIAATSIL